MVHSNIQYLGVRLNKQMFWCFWISCNIHILESNFSLLSVNNCTQNFFSILIVSDKTLRIKINGGGYHPINIKSGQNLMQWLLDFHRHHNNSNFLVWCHLWEYHKGKSCCFTIDVLMFYYKFLKTPINTVLNYTKSSISL